MADFLKRRQEGRRKAQSVCVGGGSWTVNRESCWIGWGILLPSVHLGNVVHGLL